MECIKWLYLKTYGSMATIQHVPRLGELLKKISLCLHLWLNISSKTLFLILSKEQIWMIAICTSKFVKFFLSSVKNLFKPCIIILMKPSIKQWKFFWIIKNLEKHIYQMFKSTLFEGKNKVNITFLYFLPASKQEETRNCWIERKLKNFSLNWMIEFFCFVSIRKFFVPSCIDVDCIVSRQEGICFHILEISLTYHIDCL